jgi:ankyrin repeat protein
MNDADARGCTAVHFAAQVGYLPLISKIAAMGGKIDQPDTLEMTPLHYAATYNQQEVVKFLLSRGVFANAVDCSNRTALHYACCHNLFDIASMLVTIGKVDVDLADVGGNTALHLACEARAYSIAEWLVEYCGADMDKLNLDRLSAFSIVHHSGSVSFATSLMEKAILAKSVRSRSIKTKQLLDACAAKEWNLVAAIIATGTIDVNACNEQGKTPFSFACEAGALETVKSLMEHGSKVHERDMQGRTGLHYACIKDHLAVAHFLVSQHGLAILNDLDHEGNSELYYACTSARDEELIKLLVRNGSSIRGACSDKSSINKLVAFLSSRRELVGFLIEECDIDIEIFNSNRYPVDLEFYQWAREKKSEMKKELTAELSKFLEGGEKDVSAAMIFINRGADVNVVVSRGLTPLHDACMRGDVDYVRLLISHGANSSAMDQYGNTPMHIASYMGSLEIVRWLKKSGATISALNIQGLSPLHYACLNGQLTVVKWLVDRGGDIVAKGENGMTPFLLACESGNLELVQWLEPIYSSSLQGGGMKKVDLKNPIFLLPIEHAVVSGNIELVTWWLNKVECPSSVAEYFLSRARKASMEKSAESAQLNFRRSCAVGDVAACRNHIANSIDVNATGSISKNVDAILPSYLLYRPSDALTPFKGLTGLQIAARMGYVEIVRLFINRPETNFNGTDAQGRNCLHLSCLNGSLEIVKILLSTGSFDVFQQDAEGNSLLHLAAMSKNEFLVIYLIDCYPMFDEDAKNHQKLSCRDISSDLKLNSVTSWLSEHPRFVRITTEFCGACAQGDVLRLNKLVSLGADIDGSDEDGMRPIHFAASKNQIPVVTRLLELNCERDAVTSLGTTALMLASEFGYLDVVKLLVFAGADVNKQDGNGFSAFLFAAIRGRNQIVSFLHKNGAQLTAVTKRSQNALHLACISESFPTLKYLIEFCPQIPPDAFDKDGLKPVDIASKKFQMEMVTCIQCAEIISRDNKLKELELRNEIELQKAEARALQQAKLKEQYIMVEAQKEANTPMFLDACFKGDIHLVREMLKSDKVHINAGNEDGFTAVHMACITGNMELIQLLVSHKGSLDVINNHGCTPLYYACASGNDVLSQWLVDLGADLLKAANDGTTALHCLCAKDRHVFLGSLLSRNSSTIDVNMKFEPHSSFLQVACMNGAYESAKVLIAHGANVLDDLDANMWSLLHLTSMTGNIKLTELLLDHGLSLKHRDNDGATPLIRACAFGHRKLAQYLVGRGAQINDTDSAGNTCLHMAAASGSTEVCKWLMQSGLNVFIPNNDGKSAAMIAKLGHYNELIQFLKKYSKAVSRFMNSCSFGDVNAVQTKLKSGLINASCTNEALSNGIHFGAGSGELIVCKTLYAAGCPFDSLDIDGMTPLHWAVAGGHDFIVKWLVGKGADVSARSSDGRNLLHRAAFHGQHRIIDLILSYATFPYPIDSENSDGFTPLMDACSSGHIEGIRCLLNNGASLLRSLPNGCNIVHLICRQGRSAVLDWLFKSYWTQVEYMMDFSTEVNGTTPFFCACINGSVPTLNVLVKHGLDLEAALVHRNSRGETALHLACAVGNLDVVMWLMHRGASPLVVDATNKSPYEKALHHNHIEVAEWLRENMHAPVSVPLTVYSATNTSVSRAPSLDASIGGNQVSSPNIAQNALSYSQSSDSISYQRSVSKDHHVNDSLGNRAPNSSVSDALRAQFSQNTLSTSSDKYSLQSSNLNINASPGRQPRFESGKASLSRSLSNDNAVLRSPSKEFTPHASLSQTSQSSIIDNSSRFPRRVESNGVSVSLSRSVSNENTVLKTSSRELVPSSTQSQVSNIDISPRFPRKVESGAISLSRSGSNDSVVLKSSSTSIDVGPPAPALNANSRAAQPLRPLASPIKPSTYASGRTLHSAVAAGDLASVNQHVINKTASLDEVDAEGNSPLIVACDKKLEDIALLLIRSGANLNFVSRSTGDTAFHKMCYRGMTSLLRAVADLPGSMLPALNLETKNHKGETPIIIAANGCGNPEMLRLLLQLGANVRCQDRAGQTALHHAFLRHNPAFVRLLIAHNAPLDIRNRSGETPLELCELSRRAGESDAAFIERFYEEE